MSFLPENYELPKSDSNYLEFQEGLNQFRVLSDCKVGWSYWEDEKGNPLSSPMKGCLVRYVKNLEAIPQSVQASPNLRPRHFWAFICWNYQAEQVQLCKLTQTSIMTAMDRFLKNPQWGDPRGPQGYDFIVEKSGDGLNTKYQVMVNPKGPLDEGIERMFQDMHIDLEALFRGEDVFSDQTKNQAQPQPTTNSSVRPLVQANNGVYVAR